MGFFNAVIAAFSEGHRPHAALLVEHDFPYGMARNWTGIGTLHLYDVDWIGCGDLVKMSDLGFGADDAAQPFTMTLSGVNPQFTIEARTMPTARNRSQKIWLQFFDPDSLQPIDDRYLLADRVMDVMGFSRSGPASRSISLSSEDIWVGLNTTAHATYSDTDQQARFPGDRGFEFTEELRVGSRIDWPDFSDE